MSSHLDISSGSSMIETAEPGSGGYCHCCPQSKTRQGGVACCSCFASLIVLYGISIGVRLVVRSHEVSAYRGPFLEALDDAAICSRKGVGGRCDRTCAVELGSLNATYFDLHPAENLLFGFIFEQLVNRSHDKMIDILGGAHVQFHDPDGCDHKFLTNLPGAYKRISSHPSTTAQYGITEGRVIHTILMGTNEDKKTWFQLEGAPWGATFVDSINHILDASIYFITGRQRQMGPLGTSAYTDKSPLVVGAPRPGLQVCATKCENPPSHHQRQKSGQIVV